MFIKLTSRKDSNEFFSEKKGKYSFIFNSNIGLRVIVKIVLTITCRFELNIKLYFLFFQKKLITFLAYKYISNSMQENFAVIVDVIISSRGYSN